MGWVQEFMKKSTNENMLKPVTSGELKILLRYAAHKLLTGNPVDPEFYSRVREVLGDLNLEGYKKSCAKSPTGGV